MLLLATSNSGKGRLSCAPCSAAHPDPSLTFRLLTPRDSPFRVAGGGRDGGDVRPERAPQGAGRSPRPPAALPSPTTPASAWTPSAAPPASTAPAGPARPMPTAPPPFSDGSPMFPHLPSHRTLRVRRLRRRPGRHDWPRPRACARASSPTHPRGEHGFGYDPIFLLPAVWANDWPSFRRMEKNQISHRARAIDALAPGLSCPFPKLPRKLLTKQAFFSSKLVWDVLRGGIC